MILVFGGAYQGKLDFVLQKFNLEESDVFFADECSAFDIEKISVNNNRVIYGFENLVFSAIKQKKDVDSWCDEIVDTLADKIVICRDISQGIVPLDKDERAWREAVGRCTVKLALKSDRVYRIFCGIPQLIKGDEHTTEISRDAKLSKVVVIRHGITEGNIKRWFYGSTDLPLLQEGIEELNSSKEKGLYPKLIEPTKFFTTGLLRTEQTLDVIYGKVDRKIIPELAEMKFGRCECKSFNELKGDDEFEAWLSDETGNAGFSGGESRNEFTNRVDLGIERLIKEHLENNKGETVSLVICHGGVISYMLDSFFPGEKDSIWEWMPEPGYGYEILFEDEHPVTAKELAF